MDRSQYGLLRIANGPGCLEVLELSAANAFNGLVGDLPQMLVNSPGMLGNVTVKHLACTASSCSVLVQGVFSCLHMLYTAKVRWNMRTRLQLFLMLMSQLQHPS